MGEREKGSFILMLAITDPLLLREASTEHVRQISRASTALHTYATSEVRVRELFLRLFPEKSCLRLFERQHITTEHSNQKEGLGEDCTFQFCSDYDESFASHARNRARE